MPTKRIDDFMGDDRTYAGYLLEIANELPLPECIRQLEKQVKEVRQRHGRASNSPINQLDEEVQVARQGEGRASNSPTAPFVFTGYPTPPSHDQLVFETWNPTTDYKEAPLAAVWPLRTVTFFQDLPMSEEQWLERRESVHLSSADDILRTVDCLMTSRLGDHRSSITDHTIISDLQDALNTFAWNAGSMVVAGKLGHNVSHFHSLVFIATCCVALYEGHPQSSVDDAQRGFLAASRGKCEARAGQLANDRAAVRWLLQEMQRQFRRGLQHRAFEIFLNGKGITLVASSGTNIITEGKSLNFYARCPRDPISNDVFTNKIPLCEVPDEIHASLPFWIPFFVKFHVGGRWR